MSDLQENGPWGMPRFQVQPIYARCVLSKNPSNILKYLFKVKKTISQDIRLQKCEASHFIIFCPNIWYTLSEYLMQQISIVTIFDGQ